MSAINLNVNSFTDFETIPNDSHPPTFDDTHNFTKLPTSQIDIEDDQVTLLQLMIHKSSFLGEGISSLGVTFRKFLLFGDLRLLQT